MKVKVNSSTVVKPATAAESNTLQVSNMDITIPENCHILSIYFYRPTGADDFFDAEVLKASLSRTLDEFYPLAGRLHKDLNCRIKINCNGEGALFMEAESDATVDDFADFTHIPDIDLIPKLTRFRCGGVGLAFANEHHLMDGFCGTHFINTLARMTRGLDITSKPFLDRRVLSARNPPQPQFQHVEYLPPPPLRKPKNNSNASETAFSVLKLSRDQINALKAQCRGKYTTIETLAGHAWRCVSKARGLPEDQETKCYIPVDGRSRLRPPLPQGYFGNVVFKATTIALCGELETNSFEFAVGKVHEAIARMDDDYLRSAIDYIETINGELDKRTLGPAPYKCPNLGVVSWARFNFYEADFGWGKPVHLGFGGVPSEGNSFVLPSPTTTNDGSLLYAIALPKEQMQLFENIFYDI